MLAKAIPTKNDRKTQPFGLNRWLTAGILRPLTNLSMIRSKKRKPSIIAYTKAQPIGKNAPRTLRTSQKSNATNGVSFASSQKPRTYSFFANFLSNSRSLSEPSIIPFSPICRILVRRTV